MSQVVRVQKLSPSTEAILFCQSFKKIIESAVVFKGFHAALATSSWLRWLWLLLSLSRIAAGWKELHYDAQNSHASTALWRCILSSRTKAVTDWSQILPSVEQQRNGWEMFFWSDNTQTGELALYRRMVADATENALRQVFLLLQVCYSTWDPLDGSL